VGGLCVEGLVWDASATSEMSDESNVRSVSKAGDGSRGGGVSRESGKAK
jgi:hypothetical protein